MTCCRLPPGCSPGSHETRQRRPGRVQTCGVVPPIALADGWFARRLCSCERAAFEAEQLRLLQEEQRQARTALTYTWLGRAWSEPGLAAKTFATFRGERQPDAYELAQAFAAAILWARWRSTAHMGRAKRTCWQPLPTRSRHPGAPAVSPRWCRSSMPCRSVSRQGRTTTNSCVRR